MKIKIFVSYAHADMKSRPGFKHSRVSMILQDIEHELRTNDRRSEFIVLRDENGLLFAGDNLDVKITDAIEHADIGLILVSRSYCYSEECRKELIQLIKKKKKLCIVETENAWQGDYEEVLNKEFPDLSRVIRSKFWERRAEGDIDFGWPSPTADVENASHYYGAVRFVKQSLEKMRHSVLAEGEKTAQTIVEEMPVHMVFMASPTSDVKRHAERLSQTLRSNGYSVFQFDQRRHLTEDSNVDQVLKTITGKCQILIQMLGSVPGGRINGGGSYLVPQQHQIMNGSGKDVYVWEEPSIERSECSDEYQEFLNSVQSHTSGYQEFETYILKQVEKVSKEQEAVVRRNEARKEASGAGKKYPFVGIDYAAQDRPIAEAVLNAIVKHANVEPLPFDISSQQLEHAVTDNDGIVMIYGNSNAGQKRIGAHFGIVQRYKNRNDDVWFDVAIGNGFDEAKDGQNPLLPRGPNVHVIGIETSGSGVVDQAALSRFIDDIKNNALRRNK